MLLPNWVSAGGAQRALCCTGLHLEGEIRLKVKSASAPLASQHETQIKATMQHAANNLGF